MTATLILMAAPAFKTPLNPPNLCPEIPTLPNLDRPLGILPAKEKCRSWIYSTLLPVLGIPSLLELLHAPPETAATATAALQINNKSSLKSCKSLTTVLLLLLNPCLPRTRCNPQLSAQRMKLPPLIAQPQESKKERTDTQYGDKLQQSY